MVHVGVSGVCLHILCIVLVIVGFVICSRPGPMAGQECVGARMVNGTIVSPVG